MSKLAQRSKKVSYVSPLESTHCSGSYSRRTSTKGRRIVNGRTKYPCPVCHKLMGVDHLGQFNKHGWRNGVDKEKAGVTSICSECGKSIEGIDYLCSRCRG